MLAGGSLNRAGYSCFAGVAARAGLEGHAEAHAIEVSPKGIAFDVKSSWGEARIESALLGRFNVSNLLGVLTTMLVSGVPFGRAAAALAELQPVAGRMQRLGGGGWPLVVVDYAHTPDALEKTLVALKDIARASGGRLVAVFGAGGERDRGKRPLMGAVASRHADAIMVTSDNPRGEDPAAIIAEITAAIPVAHEAVEERRTAIARAIASAGADDVVLIAGKGHEKYRKSPAADCLSPMRSKPKKRSRDGADDEPARGRDRNRARLVGEDVRFASVSTDSRTLERGALFIALRGERFDGRRFIGAAKERGAAAAVVEDPDASRAELPFLVVENSRLALGRLAAHWRGRFDIPLVAVVGSNGKTTVKEMIAAILREHFGATRALASEGNLNNDIGLPLTLLRLRRTTAQR